MSRRRFSKTSPLADKNVSDFDNVFKRRTCFDKEVDDCICLHCGKKLAQKESLKIHVSNFHEKIKHQCVHCKKEFNQRSSLITHISNIHENRGHRCSNCKMIFTQRSSLSTHFKNVHERVKYECKLCGALKNSKSILWNHMKSYHESRIIKSAKKVENGAKLENPNVKFDLTNPSKMSQKLKTNPEEIRRLDFKDFSNDKTSSDTISESNNRELLNINPDYQLLTRRPGDHSVEKSIRKEFESKRLTLVKIEENCDQTLLKEELESQNSEMDDDDIPDLETENLIETLVGNKEDCAFESKEFNHVFDIKDKLRKEPTDSFNVIETNSFDNLFKEVANSQPKFKQVSTRMKENQNQRKDNLTENIKFLKDIIFEEPNEDMTEIKVEKNQEIKVEQNQEIKVEQNQDISELKSIGSNDQEPVPLKITFFTCILCLNKYGSSEDVKKHLSIFHKISVKFQKQFIKTGCFA